MKNFSISDIPEFSKKERIVVVGVIGKSPYRYPNKTIPLVPSADCEENGIQCYWDERGSILYLHATTYLDTKQLTTLAANLDENSKATDKDADASHWLVASGELAAESCKIISLIFHLCHIVVLSSPTPVFDLGYLQLFKAIDAFRTELQPQTTEALNSSGAGGTWETHGRSCCPRLLFHFHRAPRPLRKNVAGLKRLEHAVEDQLYFILRKARIITNVCAKSLFAIPKNEEFVYINADDEAGAARDVSALVRGLVGLCTGAAPVASAERTSFKQFLNGHVELAFGVGFDDNVGKYAMSTSFFELPSATSWRLAACALAPVYFEQPLRSGDDDTEPGGALHDALATDVRFSQARCAKLLPACALAPVYLEQPLRSGDDDTEPGGALHDVIATDVRFSQARCAKVLPIAQASYAEGLPAHYSSQHHAHKLSLACSVLESQARGPLGAAAQARLVAACCAAWRARRLCEARSLTDHCCIEPQHCFQKAERYSQLMNDNSKEHSSGVRYVSACNCGRTKTSRDDPYSVRRANCTFYTQAADECPVCPSLTTVEFPVFEPSTPTYRAASVKGSGGQSSQEGPVSEARCDDGDTQASAPEGAWSGEPEPLSPGSQGEEAEEDDTEKVASSPSRSPRGFELVAIREDSGNDRGIIRQPSTTEYLPGMLHLESPPGLLPAYPSWSLLCLGASSLYSHSLGLPEHLHPGFLPHTNFLLPWDCAVSRMEQVSAWRMAQAASRGRGTKPPPPAPQQLTVKIFIGFEYECPRGHRFMMSSPDSVVSGGGGCSRGGAGGAGGARLAQSEMPLYYVCPCRGSKAMQAQCMRIHVVTPKAPLHVTLDPKVQPVPSGPTFVPLPPGSPRVKLSASAYWVLRLPYIYSAERGPLPRPHTPQAQGTIKAPLFGLAD